MRNIIKKILREGFDDFEWVNEVPTFEPGKNFTEEDICFDEDGYGCEISINADEITFDLDYNTWLEYVDVADDYHLNYLQSLLYHDGDYDGGGDYYDFDSDEFNYFSYFSDEQTNKINEILESIGSDEKLETFVNNQNLWELTDELKYPPLQDYFETLGSDYLGIIGYTIQKNRWISLSRYFKDIVEQTGCNWYMPNYDKIQITVPLNVFWELRSNNKVETLSDLLERVSQPLVEEAWGDMFYDDWDISGGEQEIDDIINTFIERSEEFIEDSEEVEGYRSIINMIDKLGFKQFDSRIGQYKRENKNNTWWYLKVNFNDEKATLSLHEEGKSLWYGDPIRKFSIPLDKLPDYVENYSLKLESTKK